MNYITITGALGRTPSLNRTQAGKAAWGFPLGYTPQRKNDQTGQWETTGPTLWFDVTVWGDDAVDLAQRYADVEKGRATVTGRLGSKTWTNRDGVEQAQMTITADAVTIHPSRQRQQQSGGWGQQQTQSAQQPSDPWNPDTGSGGWGGQQPESIPF